VSHSGIACRILARASAVSHPNLPDHKNLSCRHARRKLRCTLASLELTINRRQQPNDQTIMSMSPKEVESLARELLTASETGQMVNVPPSERPGFDLDTAYQVESTLKELREAVGHRAIGQKVGYANKAMWRILKLETLVWAHMYDDTVHYSDHNSATLSLARPRSLKIEPEIVFGLKEAMAVESPLDAAAALARTEWLAIGFEIIDCPFPEWKFQPSDFVASFGLHAALIVGEKIPVQSESIPTLMDELSRFKVRMSRNGAFVEEGAGRNALKNPASCLAELSTAIARRFPDQPLRAGEIVSAGTLTAGHATGKDDGWKVDVEGISLPSLSLRLT
jgi:2-keto-4-pentenoate hydratase